ncbi:MAG: tripartite tricarboxylate transporter TctB family protein [Burkholderiales bacterium]
MVLLLLGVLVMYDSRGVGASWADDGPQSGYFPFRVGLLISLASAWIAVQKIAGTSAAREVFVEPAKLRLVLSVLVPSAVYITAIYLIGIYLASALFIALFMRWQGGFTWRSVFPVALGVPGALFVLFEVWFLLPLPRGPLETLLGY